jgi:RecA-family ATPase
MIKLVQEGMDDKLKDIKPFNMDHISKNPGKPRENLLEPWLPRAGLAMVYASSGVGKTFFCLNSAYAMASGGEFLKFKSKLPCRVLYIDGEMSYDALQPRIMMILKLQGNLDDPDNFQLITCDQFENMIIPKISTLEGQEFYNAIIEQGRFDVIFMDNISTLTTLVENKSEEWQIVQQWLIQLRANGKSVVLIHHTGKDKKSQRGTSRREDILDTAILLEEADSEEQGEEKNQFGTNFKITFSKKRNFFGQDAESFEAYLGHNAKWTMKTQSQSTFDKVVELSKLGLSQTEIAIELKINRSNVCRAYKKAVEMGLISEKTKGSRKNAQKSTYHDKYD